MKIKLLVVFLFITLLGTNYAQAIAPEIPDPSLPDIAMASIDQFGRPVIYYNPMIARQVGPAISEFFRMHEHGHHALNHLRREYFDANQWNRSWVRQSYEKEADCFAARNVHPQVAKAAIQFFIRMQGSTRPSWYHPTGYERAAVIQSCVFG